MNQPLAISPVASSIVLALQEAGYEAYIVGGAVRDLLLGRTPKDFDISTSATPEEIRAVFGRRQARIIGKRFRLVHLHRDGDIYEISTFRKAPQAAGRKDSDKPEHMILNDNDYGTAEEDVWRRDFTVNALFYDPAKEEVIDLTGMGLKDISASVIRAIGDPQLRFEEDPVRILRALKLVAQFDFSLDAPTENALFASLHLFCHASPSRLALELEKILKSSYCDRHFEVFHDYGLLPYFLPELSAIWGVGTQERICDLLYERNCRIDAGFYRNSVSLAIAVVALPFLEEKLGGSLSTMWPADTPGSHNIIMETVDKIFKPQSLMVRMRESACRILSMQPLLEIPDNPRRGELMQQRAYAHARELLIIRHTLNGDAETVSTIWPRGSERSSGRNSGRSAKPEKRRHHSKRHFKSGKPDIPWNKNGDE